MTDYPLALYREDGPIKWDGRMVAMKVVADADERAAAESDGWRAAADFLSGAPGPTLLDGNARDIEPALPALSLEELETLKAAEQAGKTRKGVLASIDAAIDAQLA